MIFLELWYDFFRTYDITTEVVMLVILLILRGIMAFSKPEKTVMLKIFYLGITFAFITMVFHIVMLCTTVAMRKTFNIVPFNVMYVLYSISYVILLNIIIIYHNQLSFKRRFEIKLHIFHCIFFSVIWLVLMLLPMFKGKLLMYDNGSYVLTVYSDVYVFCSLSCAVLTLVITIINKKTVTRIVFWGSLIFIPIIILGVVLQFYFPTAYFTCATFTLPFLIYYILFHSFKYDEVTGCQGYVAYRALVKKFFTHRKNFLEITVMAPKLAVRDLSEIETEVVYFCNYMSRAIEKIDRNIRVYFITNVEYNIVCRIKSEEEAQIIKEKLMTILSEPVNINGVFYDPALNFLVSGLNDNIKTVEEYLALKNLKRKQFMDLDFDQTLYITDEDVIKNKRHYKIEKNLFEIKSSGRLDDDRVLVYIQPIFSIESGDFRTGETLMRMKIDGEMIFPDEFIPIAENCGCIHMLTRIIMYNAAKIVVTMKKEGYDIDALTVNVSTMELIEPNVCGEFMGIIDRAGAGPLDVRMEITESTNISDYNMVISNIKQLTEAGVKFYLDDFGTGYSNLDRVLGIPFSTIKFDKSLLYKAMEDKRTEDLFLFLARFVKNNKRSLVIEGVENEEQRDFVKSAGFDYIQGYLYSKPIPANEVKSFFKLKK